MGSFNKHNPDYWIMANYDFIDGNQRIKNILDLSMTEEKRKDIPSIGSMTYDRYVTTNISAIFVDIRNSTKLFADKDRDMVSRIIKSFVSEIIHILEPDSGDIGIRGDCVYAIYSTSK